MGAAGDALGDLLSTPLHDEQDETEEFINRNHTPTSAHPNLATMPAMGSKVTPHAPGNKTTIAFAKSVYNMKFPNGVVAEVDDTSYDGEGSLNISGSFYDYNRNPGGEPHVVGTFERKWDAVPGEVHHDLLMVDPHMQGQGMATQFNAHAEGMYKAYGVHAIFLDAASSVGGYTWATAGYDWNGEMPQHIRGQIRAIGVGAEQFPSHYDESLAPTQLGVPSIAEQLLTPKVRAEFYNLSARVERGERVAPFEIAQVGKDQVVMVQPTGGHWHGDEPVPDQPMWAGKALLLGNTWYAVKRLDVTPKVSVNTPSDKLSDRARLQAIMSGSIR